MHILEPRGVKSSLVVLLLVNLATLSATLMLTSAIVEVLALMRGVEMS